MTAMHGHNFSLQIPPCLCTTMQANFIGLPAISMPVGYDSKGLPIGLHMLGKPWKEGTLLR